MLLLLLCIAVTQGSDVTQGVAQGFGGATAADYLEDDVSVFLGVELYSKAYAVQDDEARFDDVMMDGISDAFAIADTDKNGTIDHKELASHLGRNKYDLLNTPLLKKYHQLDQDNNGELSWREYFAKSFSPQFVDSVNRGHVDIEVLTDVKTEYEHFSAHFHLKRFNAADQDNSDYLSPKEFIMFMRPEEFVSMRDVYFEELVQDLKSDTDDENVSHDEYMQHVQGIVLANRPEDLAEFLAKEEAKFKKFDADSNGKLNNTETREWMFGSINTKDHTHLVKDEVKDFYKVIDKDNNGQLSFDEVIAGSEYVYHGTQPQSFDSMGFVNNTGVQGDPADIWPLFTPEAIAKLEAEVDDDEFEGKIAGLAPEVNEGGIAEDYLEYEPEFDPDNPTFKWGFVREHVFRKPQELSIVEWLHEVKTRNGFTELTDTL